MPDSKAHVATYRRHISYCVSPVRKPSPAVARGVLVAFHGGSPHSHVKHASVLQVRPGVLVAGEGQRPPRLPWRRYRAETAAIQSGAKSAENGTTIQQAGWRKDHVGSVRPRLSTSDRRPESKTSDETAQQYNSKPLFSAASIFTRTYLPQYSSAYCATRYSSNLL